MARAAADRRMTDVAALAIGEALALDVALFAPSAAETTAIALLSSVASTAAMIASVHS